LGDQSARAGRLCGGHERVSVIGVYDDRATAQTLYFLGSFGRAGGSHDVEA